YGGGGEEALTRRVAKWADEVDAEECERVVLKRLRNGINTGVDEDEIVCRKAIAAEEAGDLAEARELWSKLDKYRQEPLKPEPSDKRSYGLLAQARLLTLDEGDQRAKRLGKGATAGGPAQGVRPPPAKRESGAAADRPD